MLLPLPLGEVASPQAMTERAHAVSPVAKVSGAMRNLPGVQNPSPGRGKVAATNGSRRMRAQTGSPAETI